MMLFKLSDEKILHFTTHILNLQSSMNTQNSEISLRTFVENVSHLAITIQDFSLSISLRGGGAQTGSLTHLKHRGHNTEDTPSESHWVLRGQSCVRSAEAAITDWHLQPLPCPRILASTFPGAENRDRAIGGERGTTLVRILLYFANFSALDFNT